MMPLMASVRDLSSSIPSLKTYSMCFLMVLEGLVIFYSGMPYHLYPKVKGVFHVFFGGIGKIVPLKEKLFVQISGFQFRGNLIVLTENSFRITEVETN